MNKIVQKWQFQKTFYTTVETVLGFSILWFFYKKNPIFGFVWGGMSDTKNLTYVSVGTICVLSITPNMGEKGFYSATTSFDNIVFFFTILPF